MTSDKHTSVAVFG